MSSSSPEPKPEPYKISVSEELLTWINDRVRTARIPPGKDLPIKDLWTWGLPVETATKIHDHWTKHYDWRKVESQLNSELQQFTLPIEHNEETLQIHFVHHRSTHPNAIPLLFIHGWPGSFLEVRPIINFLTSPANPSTQQAYHVVAPSLPGFGFSSHPLKPFSPMDHAAVCHKLMTHLSYTTYISQGGDWGSMIARLIGIDQPTSCPAVHVNMIAAALPSPVWQPLSFARVILGFVGGTWIVSEYEKRLLDRTRWWASDESGYLEIQGTKPQTLQYALADSPFGFVCWIRDKLEHLVDYDTEWTWKEDEVITMVMPYIINGTSGHAEIYKWAHASTYRDDFNRSLFAKTLPPTSYFGASIFPKEAISAPRHWAEAKVARNIVFWKQHDRGGHFASLESPVALVDDVREFTGKIGGEVLGRLKRAGE